MLRNWTVSNFKSAQRQTTLELAPLTVFAGANSAGKSSVIQSILLTGQTVQSAVFNRPVILNGNILRLGTFSEVVSTDHQHESISIGFSITPARGPESAEFAARPGYTGAFYGGAGNIELVECRYRFSARGSEVGTDLTQLQPTLDESYIRTRAAPNERRQAPLEEILHLRRSRVPAELRARQFSLVGADRSEAELSALEYDVVSPGSLQYLSAYYEIPQNAKAAGALFQHFLPGRVAVVFDAVEAESAQFVRALVEPDRYPYRTPAAHWEPGLGASSQFRSLAADIFRQASDQVLAGSRERFLANVQLLEQDFSPDAVRRVLIGLPSSVRASLARQLTERADELMAAARAGRPPQMVLWYAPPSELTGRAISYIQQYFVGLVRYLGPLRDEPKPGLSAGCGHRHPRCGISGRAHSCRTRYSPQHRCPVHPQRASGGSERVHRGKGCAA